MDENTLNTPAADPPDSYEEFLRKWKERYGSKGDGAFGRAVAALYRTAKGAANVGYQGVAKGINELSNTVVGAAVLTSKATGIYKLGRDEQEQQDFLESWAPGIRKANPLQLPVSGDRAEGIGGFIEGVIQFGVGFAGASKYLKGYQWFKKLPTVAKGAVAGAAVDLSFMDPYEERLSNLIESGPEWLSNPLTQYLQAEEDDSELEARLKAVLEGGMTGAMVDGVLYAAKAVRARRLARKGKIEPSEAAKRIQEAAEEAAAASEARKDPVFVEHNPDGTATIRVREPEVVQEAVQDAEGVRVANDGGTMELVLDSPAQAESIAASINEAIQVASRPKEVTPELLDNFRTILKRIEEGVDPNDTAQLRDGVRLNLRHIDTPEDARAVLNAFAETITDSGVLEKIAKGELARDGRYQSWDDLRKIVADAFPNTDPEQFLARAAEVSGQTENLAAWVLASREYIAALGRDVAELSRRVDLSPDDPVLMDELRKTFNTLHTMYTHFIDSSGNIARALGAHRIPVQGASPTGKAAAGAVEGATGAKPKKPGKGGAKPGEGGAKPGKGGAKPGKGATEGGGGQASKKPRAPITDDTVIHAEGPNTWTVADEAAHVMEKFKKAVEAKVPDIEDLLDDIEAQRRILREYRATIGVNADDFIKSRERRRALRTIKRARNIRKKLALGDDNLPDWLLEDNASLRGERIFLEAELQRADGLKASAEDEALVKKGLPKSRNPIEELAKAVEREQRELTKIFKLAQTNPTVPRKNIGAGKQKSTRPPRELNPFEKYIREQVKAGRVFDRWLTKQGVSWLKSNADAFGIRKIDPTRNIADQLSPDDLRALARQIHFAEGDPSRILAALRSTVMLKQAPKDPTWKDRVLGVRVNMMLSGPKTHIVNATSNAITMAQIPAEYFFGGVLTRNKALRQQGLDMLSSPFVEGGMILRDAATAALKAFKDGAPILDAVAGKMEVDASLNGKNFLARFFGTALGLPGRAIMTADEFFKQVNYRSHVRAQSLRAAREQAEAMGLRADEIPDFLAQRVAQDLEMSFDVLGGAVNPLALQHSRYATFTNPLADNTLGKSLQDAAEKHPSVRFIFPFIRTPVNLFQYSWQRFPVLGAFQRQMREDIAAGGERRAVALARQASGLMMYSMAAYLAYSGVITGRGPKNPKLRKQWLDAGNQPYSVRVGGKQYSFLRLEPQAMPLSLVADLVESMGELDEESMTAAVSALVTAFASAASSKTFMRGMSEFFDVATGRDARLTERFINQSILSFTPNFMRQVNPDPMYREARGLIEELQSRIPGWSESLEPRRNIFGEPVAKPPGYFMRTLSPVATMDVPDDYVANELLKLGEALPMPRKKLDGGIDLTDRQRWDNGSGQSPYDRMMELIAHPPKGPSLRERLLKEMASESWQKLSDGTDAYPGGAKLVRATAIVTEAQQRAFEQMLKEYPALQQAVQQTRRDRVNALKGSSGILNAVSQ